MEYLDYQEEMGIFYREIASFIEKHRSLLDEIEQKGHIFDSLRLREQSKRTIFFDWFVFDCQSDVCAKTPLRYFLEKGEVDEEMKELFRGFLNNVYSVFEIKALKMGKEMMAVDVLTDREYTVKDKSLSSQAIKGQLVIMRILPFGGYYIATGEGHIFPLDISPLIKLKLKSEGKLKKKERLNLLDVCQVLFMEEEKEKRSAQEDFVSLCQKGGLGDSEYAQTVMAQMKEEARQKGDPNRFTREILDKIRPYPGIRVVDVARVINDLWNSFIAENDPVAVKGPLEEALIDAGMAYVHSKVDPSRFKDSDKANVKANKLYHEWLNSAKEELGGQSPREVILEERKELGNPQMEVDLKFFMTALNPFGEFEAKLEDLFEMGLKCLKKEDYDGAIYAYEQYCSLENENHTVWNNLGNAYLLSAEHQDVKKARECFERALEIDPDYKLAMDNLFMMMISSKKSMRNIAKTKRIKWLNKDKVLEPIDWEKRMSESKTSSVRNSDMVKDMESIKDLIRSGQKILAIKKYMELFGGGLKKAKDAVDQIEGDL